MAYYDLAQLADDDDFKDRIGAAAQTEGRIGPGSGAVEQWVADHRWELAASPGFADAYASAIAGYVPNPGRDPSVISDAQILSAVQAIPVPEPTPAPGP
jgi:hypothetical protein